MNFYCLPPFLFFFLFSLENIIASLYILVIYLCNCHSQYLASKQQISSHQYYSDIFLGAAILMELLLLCAFEASKLICTKFHLCLLIFFNSKRESIKKYKLLWKIVSSFSFNFCICASHKRFNTQLEGWCWKLWFILQTMKTKPRVWLLEVNQRLGAINYIDMKFKLKIYM